MAVIQKIREKYAKLAGFVIALALVGFLLMDAGDNLKKVFSGGDYIAKVNGDKIEPQEYAERIDEYQSLYELMGNKIDDNTRAQIHDQVLKEMIYEKLIEDQMEDLGLTLTKEEEKDMISGANPDPLVTQFPYFKNPETGQYDPQMLAAFEGNKLDLNNPQAQKAVEEWKVMKNYIRRNRLVQKYNSLFAGAVYSPKFMLDRQVKDQNHMASIRYVKIPFTTINDNDVKVTDDDLKAYMQKHAAQYRLEDPTRSIDYVAFDVKPSVQDTVQSLNTLTQLKAEFSTTSDVESFVNRNSDEPYNNAFVNKKSFMSAYADSILSMPVGTVFGPYFENGSYKLTKVVERTSLPDSVKVRHILVKTEDRRSPVLADSVAKRKIDTVQMALNSGVEFKQVAERYSDDPGSKTTGGEYTFTLQQRGQLSKEFADFAFEGKAGEKKVVKAENDNYTGYHYIEILDQKNLAPASKLAVISKGLFPSEETEQSAYAKANEFAGRNSTDKAFDEAVKKQGLNKLQAQNVKVNDFIIPGVGPSRDVIRWMYEAEVGNISPVFTLEGRYIIAKLTGVQEEGMMQLDASNRPALEALVKAEKKADMIAQKYKGMTTVDAIAQTSAQPVQNADSFNAASAFIPNLGFEPKVVGYSFFDGFKPNATSPAIKGQDGVFFVSLKSRQQNPVTFQDPMQAQQLQMQQQQMKGSISSMMQEGMRRNAEIKYSAKNLY
jgi:peptidyl-prolyl cis-trans isomerase D